MQVLVYIEMGIMLSGWSRRKWKRMVAGKSFLLLHRFNFKELRNLKKGQGSECSFHTLFTNIKYCPCKIASPRFWVQFDYPKRFVCATLPPGFGKITKRNVARTWLKQSSCFMPILDQRHPVLLTKDYFIYHSFKVLLWLTRLTLRLQGGKTHLP